jgi:hypothetical protein
LVDNCGKKPSASPRTRQVLARYFLLSTAFRVQVEVDSIGGNDNLNSRVHDWVGTVLVKVVKVAILVQPYAPTPVFMLGKLRLTTETSGDVGVEEPINEASIFAKMVVSSVRYSCVSQYPFVKLDVLGNDQVGVVA